MTEAQRLAEIIEHDHAPFASRSTFRDAAAELRRLEAECEALRKDAERYRFMRDADRSDDNCPYEQMLMYAMETLDEAVDAAIAASKGEQA